MNIEIIDKVDVPAGRIRWQRLLPNLAYDEAIKLVFSDKGEAKRQQNNVTATFRETRVGKQDFRIETQVTQLTEDQWALFIWKEKRSKEVEL